MEENGPGGNNRMVLLLIAGIPVTVILISTWLWYYVVQGDLDLVALLGTSNNGTLLQPPRQLDGVELSDADGMPLKFTELDSRWTFLIPGAARCDVACEKTLYTTRQIHIAMGKEINRIRRIYVSDTPAGETELTFLQLSDNRPAPADFPGFLSLEHRGMKAFTTLPGQFQALFREYDIEHSTWYLVDPAGWIMMSYDSEVDYKGVMSDLKFLLKNSSE